MLQNVRIRKKYFIIFVGLSARGGCDRWGHHGRWGDENMWTNSRETIYRSQGSRVST